MANNIPFTPMGKTFKATGGNNTAVTIAIVSDSPAQQYMIANHDTAKVAYCRISASNVAAVLPDSSGQYGFPIPQSSVVIVTGPQCTNTTSVYFSVIGEAASTEVYVTPGEGL